MFYPVESLKRGGRFYLCWVADSWPQRFQAINNRQIWSQDIRRICHDLQEVICQESRRPSKRFSLRLTSQLIHGLVLLYHRKVNVLIGDLCMIEAYAMHNTNKRCKWVEQVRVHEPRSAQIIPRLVIEDVGDEEQVEELLQRTGNIVAYVEDITLREPTLPENQPIDDGFGEMHLELPVISDRTIELMLGPDGSAAQQSVIDPWGLSPDRLIDQLRVNKSAHMERASDHDISLFNKTTAAELQAPGEFGKEIPDIQLPEIPDPQEIQLEIVPHEIENRNMPMEIEDILLEEIPIEEYQAQQHGRKRKRIVMKIDECLKLGNAYMRSRVNDVKVEQRCQDPASDILRAEVSVRQMLHRPTCAGARVTHNLGLIIRKMYLNSLCKLERCDVPEVPMIQRQHQDTRMIVEETEGPILAPVIEEPHLLGREQAILDADVSVNISAIGPNASVLEPNVSALGPNVSVLEPNVSALGPNVSALEPNASALGPNVSALGPNASASGRNVEEVQDVSLLPTQKISEMQVPDLPSAPKRRRTVGTNEARFMIDTENKENQPPNRHLDHLSEMLHEAGISDIPEKIPEREVENSQRKKSSENSETPLGSLDRTKVSLGDTDSCTDSQRMIKEDWGTFNTMVRIYHCKAAGCVPLNMMVLLSRGPVLSGHGRLTAAKCFSSLLS
ncbi:unnamed protein product [Pieris brassicae]|uniref:Rad21/Rec8-like protein N-terminal domain-containing protein n=1 Tax=Pieris brassicae TaxID=7116 RepID=A0A9P0TB62_PIEBR|nr:unnamed protein product [Pieris brassicae]